MCGRADRFDGGEIREKCDGWGWRCGGTMGAEEGTLAVMAGGDAADIERVRPYVLAMARRLTHMGPAGSGQTTKLCNQVIVGCAMAVLAEATRLAVNAGIDAKRLPEALAGGFRAWCRAFIRRRSAKSRPC